MKISGDLIWISLLFLFIAANAYKCTVFRLILSDLKNPYFSTAFSYYSSYLMLCSFVFLLLFRLKQFWLAVVFYSLQFLFLSVNLTYYFFFESYLHLNQYIHLFNEAVQLLRHTAAPLDGRLFIVFLDLPLLVGLFFFRKHISFRSPPLRYAVYAPFLILLVKLSLWNPLKSERLRDIIDDRYAGELLAVKKFGIGMVNLVNLTRINQDAKYLKALNNKGKLIETAIDTSAEVPGFFVIQIESMDSYVINKKHKGRFITPFLNRLSKTAVYYPYTLSYHKAGSTSDCEFSVINSLEPLDHFPSMKIRNYNFPNSIARSLAKDSFDVAIFHGNRGEYFNRRIAFKKMGFPAFYDIFDMKLKEVRWGAPDHEVFNFALRSLQSAKDPFFYYLITMSSHEPFTFTESYYQNPRYDDIGGKKVRNFFQCMSYVDSTLNSVVTRIREMRPNTVIFIFGDHTPGIKNDLYKQASFKESGMYFEFTPLFIITPDNRKYSEKKRVASFLDIVPTILSLCGNRHGIHSYGVNLLEPDKEFGPIPYGGTQQDRKIIFRKIHPSDNKTRKNHN